VVIDASAANLATAAPLLPETVERIHAFYDPARHDGFDLVVIPLAFVGDREEFYRCPPAPIMLVHDWLWRPRGWSTIVSLPLLKRLNLICPTHVRHTWGQALQTSTFAGINRVTIQRVSPGED
jgi:hypothetical protein